MNVLVIGGGHNGLAAALTIAGAGHAVTVLEARDQLGGIAAGESFHPGFAHRGILHDADCVLPSLVTRLGLTTQPVPETFAVGADGQPKALSQAEGWGEIAEFLGMIKGFAAPVLHAQPPSVGDDADLWSLAKPALGLRRLGRDTMMRVLRVGPSCVDDWISESLTDPAARAAACLPALHGAWMGPRSPLSTANLFLRAALAGDEIVGGTPVLIDALVGACKAAGVTLRTGSRVTRVEVAKGAVTGATLADGTTLPAEAVLSAVGPRTTLLGLVNPMHLPVRTEAEVSKVRVRGTWAKVHLALEAPLVIGGRTDLHRVCIADDPLHLERAFDDAKMGRLPTVAPPLDLRLLDGPVASILVRCAHGLGDEARAATLQGVLATLERVSPGVRDQIVAHEVLLPEDLEARFGLEGGHLFHGEAALDQTWALRPTPSLARYRTPIRGLWLGSAGCSPGGPVTAVPGTLAAKALLAG